MNGDDFKNNSNTNHDADDAAGRPPLPARRNSVLRLPALTARQEALVRKVIAMSEVADDAEARRREKLAEAGLDPWMAPEYGSDVSLHVPTRETLTLRAFIDAQHPADRSALLMVMNGGREEIPMTDDGVDYLADNAASSVEHAGAYMTSKRNCTHYLKVGLRMLAAYNSGRRGW